ncbi:ABC transporter substrate-binding protein [Methylobrevis albus]|uniref:ABC transporter substrate-binding protein n=1 Tax=Methylobrevis albus TaxID=2793297 RepID=A0A931MY97_9HYPH|nr:ABC transporter substrate-binding protein [Methylobrevis albus]MBH0236486.1 ABC transporter substrate-binding protein [Methylobrevis albus]
MSHYSQTRRGFLGASAASLLLASMPVRAFAQEATPAKIRFFGNPADYGQPYTVGILGIAHTRGFLAEEFAGENVELEFTYPAGSGPAINEAIANGQVDFARYGGFPNITGKARGLPTRLLASVGTGHAYLVVGNQVKAETVADLKGLKVAIGRGTAPHLAFIRVLEEHGLAQDDVELFDLEGGDELTAVASGAVDIGWGGGGFLKLVQDGNAKLIYTNRGKTARSNSFGGFLVTESFLEQYPATTQRVVNAYVRAAHWAAQPENFDGVLEAYAKAGESLDALRKDYEGLKFADLLNPTLDDYVLGQYQGAIDFAKENELIRNDVDLATWSDRGFVERAIAEVGATGTWAPRGADGTPA